MNSVLKTSDVAFACEQKCLTAGRHRRGSLMVEMVVCTVLLSVVAAILAPAIHSVKRQRITNRFETLALIELNNVASRLQAAQERPTEIKVSPWFANRYADAKLTVESLDDDAPDQQLSPTKITISRMIFDGEVELSRSLTTWIAKEPTE